MKSDTNMKSVSSSKGDPTRMLVVNKLDLSLTRLDDDNKSVRSTKSHVSIAKSHISLKDIEVSY